MTEDLKRLQKDFEAFREEYAWCAIVFNTHQALFHSDKETDELLPCDFLSTSAEGDVLDLIRILRRASNL